MRLDRLSNVVNNFSESSLSDLRDGTGISMLDLYTVVLMGSEALGQPPLGNGLRKSAAGFLTSRRPIVRLCPVYSGRIFMPPSLDKSLSRGEIVLRAK